MNIWDDFETVRQGLVRDGHDRFAALRRIEIALEEAQARLNSGIFMGEPISYWLGLQEQLQSALDREAGTADALQDALGARKDV